jgi:glutamine synthetase
LENVMSALSDHRERNADADQVAAIKRTIAERGVKFIYYQFVSVNGRVLAKVVPANQLDRSLAKGVQFHGTAIADLSSDRHGRLIGGGGASGAEFTAMPDLSTFAVLPWDPEWARFFCFLYVRNDNPSHGGEPLPTDPRGLLYRRHHEFRDRFGLELRSGCEPEMSWLGPDIDPRPRPGMSPAYHQGTLDMMRPIASKVISYAMEMGLEMVEGDYEDNYQLELNWMFDSAERTADRVMTYRQIVGKRLASSPDDGIVTTGATEIRLLCGGQHGQSVVAEGRKGDRAGLISQGTRDRYPPPPR